MGQNPCNIVSEKLIVSVNSALGPVLLKYSTPPIHKHYHVQQSINARGTKALPITSYFTRDHTTLKPPP